MTRCAPLYGLAFLAIVLMAGGAHSACRLETLLEMPVTVTDMQPLVAAKLNGTNVTFMTDSGAFFSQISPGKAAELRLKPGPAPFGLVVRGVGGQEKVAFVTAKSFSIAGQDLAGSFLVGGGEMGHDAVGVIGQNILGFADVEYDLGHGVIRLMRPHDCLSKALAYWAEGQSYSAIEIEAASARMTYGVAYLNGQRLRVLFDTGASTSMLTLPAARRAGLDPHAPGVVEAGPSHGIGRHLVETWIAPVDSFKVGDEEIRHTRLRFGDLDNEDFDMVLGADFFLSHRIYVANDQRRLYFTYNGGPVFNLEVAPTVKGGSALPSQVATAAAEPSTAAEFARRGAAFTSRHEYDKAIADLTRAIELAPNDPTYLFERARAYQENRQPFLAMADLNKSLALKPDDIPALTTRAAFHLAGRDKAHALADLAAADRQAAKQADVRFTLAELYEQADEPASAIGQFDLWIAAHPEDGRQALALSQRCFTRAVWNHDLDLALADCEAALKRDPKLIAARVGRGLVRLRQGDPAAAAVDFDAVLAVQPKSPWALYGRGLARLRTGQAAEGKADLAAAVALRPGLDAEAKAHGLSP
jgi:tetratricopeptide (TPR) repeat protein